MSATEWGWSDRLRLHYGPMDETHQEFVTLCAALSKNEPETFLDRLDALIVHSVEHFEQENRWMEETNFPPAGCHRQEHESVLEIMREVRKRIVDGDTELGARLAEELPHWFEHHVDTMDNMLARFMAAQSGQNTQSEQEQPA